ncbi:ArsR/SmtB family transcription factor [Pengzhenrongella phosphoraccumulans]|uniref:ArsR/SmtB family transcription factor n=1 Tax=Pengzhenrongella phosphoraccumulans TaxID=3114394 RepID=UPI00388FBDE7
MDLLRDDDDDLWKALAHPTRRQILDLLAEAPLTTGDLVVGLALDRHVVMVHLAVLRAADLVVTEKRGRYRINYLNAVPIQQIHHRWVSTASGPWAAALIAVRDEAETSARAALMHDDTTEDGKKSG